MVGAGKVQYYSMLLQELAMERFRIKLCWGGAEFLCLNLFKEIARRHYIPLAHIFKAYNVEDLERLLSTGRQLPPNELSYICG